MNFVEKFDGLLPNTDAYARGYVHVDSVSTHAPPGAIIVDDGQLLFTGDFKRTGLDLVIAKDDRELVLHDYFKGEKRARWRRLTARISPAISSTHSPATPNMPRPAAPRSRPRSSAMSPS
ncbi:hypothetical protein [Bradyrhizobium brasilense]|uniref:hypothetical protein n=1 Tax=Bradyrhizobium brasilense TaxID=1419277 RepID=UPI001E5FF139|nr:hypothetical protein [Bradyrhizobium brasilense]